MSRQEFALIGLFPIDASVHDNRRWKKLIRRCHFHALKAGRPLMRTTLALDDDLLAKAQGYTGLKDRSALVREALVALIERESARRLARLGGTEPDAEVAPRRRSRRA